MLKKSFFPLLSYVLKRSFAPTPPTLHQRPDCPPLGFRGAYGVGTRDIILPDSDAPRNRTLQATLWYPTAKPDKDPQTVIYTQKPIHFAGHAARDVPVLPDDAPYPLLVYSHGSGGVRFQSLFLLEHLASHGFVVLAANHEGNTILDSLLYGDQYEKLRMINYAERPRDLQRLIDYAEQHLSDMADIDQLGVIGHSFGGYTVFNLAGGRWDFEALDRWCLEHEDIDRKALGTVCYLRHHIEFIAQQRGYEDVPQGLWEPMSDSRVKAVVAMAPYNAPIFGDKGLASVTAPTMIMVGTQDPITIPERDAYPFYEWISSPQKTLIKFLQAGHFIYVDECLDIAREFGLFQVCSDPVWDMQRAHDLINHFLTAFMRQHLYADEQAAALLKPDSVKFVGIEYTAQGV